MIFRDLSSCCIDKFSSSFMKTFILAQQKIWVNCQLTSKDLSFNQINIQMSKNFKNKLHQWVYSLYGQPKKPKKGAGSVGKRAANFEGKESKNIMQEKMINDLFQQLEEMRERERNTADAMQLIQNFLLEEKLTMNRKQEQQISSFVQKYFAKSQESGYNCKEEVANVWNSLSETYDCVCPKTSKDLRFSEQKADCYRCSRSCHVHCLWGREKEDLYECPMCFLRNCIPNKQVKKILFAGFLRQIKKDKIQYEINLPLEICNIDKFIFQARCVRLCKDNKYEITWPINCAVFLNSKKIADFKPLNNNSSIKKRVDDEIVLDKRFLTKQNTITIEEKHQYLQGFRPTVYQNHFIMICQVEAQSVQEMVAQMMETKMSEQQSKQILRQYLDRGMHDCFIEQLKIKLKCQFYNGKITIPARSKHCISHYQPFDLRGFVMANINIRSSTQRWKCPICRERAYHLVVDEYLLGFITTHKDLTQIEFNSKGDYKMVEQQQSDNQSEKNGQQEKENPNCEIISCEIEDGNEHFISGERSGLSRQKEYNQYIQIQSEDDKEKLIEKPKRAMDERGQIEDLVNSAPQKKRKQGTVQNKPNPLNFLRLKKTTNIKDNDLSNSSEIVNGESIYSPQNSQSDFKPERKQKRERKHRKDRVFEEKVRQDLDKMSKILVPTPAISTVIPEAIRILDKKLPQVSKKASIHVPVIDIDSQPENEQTQQIRKELKLKYHLKELQKEKNFLTQKTQKCDVTADDEQLFLNLCQKFMTTSIKGC